METPLSVCNIALVACKQEPLQAADELSPAGDYCREFADHVTRLVLRSAPWTAAARVVTLTHSPALAAESERLADADYPYVFEPPGGDAALIRLWRVSPETVKWCRRGSRIVADAETFQITYSAMPRPEDWTPELVEICGLTLAKKLAGKFALSAADQQLIRQDLEDMQVEGGNIDAREKSIATLEPELWANARR